MGVPTARPSSVTAVWSSPLERSPASNTWDPLASISGSSLGNDRANPKSSTFTTPSAPTMMLSGLRSRWTTLMACAARKASAT